MRIWTNDKKDYVLSILKGDKIDITLFAEDGQVHIGTKFLSFEDAFLLSEQLAIAVEEGKQCQIKR